MVGHLEAERMSVAALMPFIRQSAAKPAAVPSLMFASLKGDADTRSEAGGILHRYHPTHPDTLKIVEGSWDNPDEWIGDLLRELLAGSAVAAERRPRLRFALASHLKLRAELPARINSELFRMQVKYGAKRVEELRKAEVAKLEVEALKLFDAVVEERDGAELLPGVTLANAARSAAYELRHLSVGKRVPEIIGEDLNGMKFRLSDYKGKVVMLSFWGVGCTACMALVPYEREIVERYKGRPFALVGVCCDKDPETVKPVLEKRKMTWRSFWCGPNGMLGELPRAWNVTAWPTVYVIDHTGIIRSKTARGKEELDCLLGDLLKKAEAADPK